VLHYLDWILDLGFSSKIILSVKVIKVLEGGFDLWLGDNIVILSMVKRAHLLFLILYEPRLSSDHLTVGRYIGRSFSVTVAIAVKVFVAATKP
jgi:hypothetical protein